MNSVIGYSTLWHQDFLFLLEMYTGSTYSYWPPWLLIGPEKNKNIGRSLLKKQNWGEKKKKSPQFQPP